MTNSRMRAAGELQGIEKRFSMWGLICEPSPSTMRPLDSQWMSLACTAMVIGLRANATAMLVPSWIVSVAVAAMVRSVNGSWLVSAAHAPS